MALYILALETSSSRCGVALLRRDGDRIEIAHRAHDGVAEHSARLLPMVDELLAEAGVARTALAAVAFGQGPGGFTGLRVACGVAQGIGFALGVPVLPVLSHASVAAQLPADAAGLRAVVLDARMDEAYVGVHAAAAPHAVVQPPVLIGIADVAAWLAARRPEWAVATGEEGLRIAGDVFATQPGRAGAFAAQVWPETLRPQAEAVARLGLAAWDAGVRVDAADARPLYVRDKVAFTTREREAGAGGNPRAEVPA